MRHAQEAFDRLGCRSHQAICYSLALTGVLCVSAFAGAKSKTPEHAAVDAGQLNAGALSLTEHFDILEDSTATLTWADVQTDAVAARFTSGQPAARALYFGVTTSAYWLRLKLKNSSDHTLDTMLELYLQTYNHHIPQRALKHQTPIQALQKWRAEKPELFVKRVYKHAGLDIKQVAVDRTSEQRRSFNLRELVGDNVAALRPSFRALPWVIEVNIPGNISCASYPGPLGQVIENLVQNAVVHAFDGRSSGKMIISASLQGKHVAMHFSDAGVGIKLASLAHIFEPFFTTRLGQGSSGLGLSISMNIDTGVLGGALNVTSETGLGAQFVLDLPLAAPNRLAAREFEPAPMSTTLGEIS
jgi:hypothetical protein